jgi:hypothetical protein
MQDTSKGVGATLSSAATSSDERGKRVWNGRGEATARRRSGYVAEMLVDGVLLYLAGTSLVWQIPFLTGAFVAPLVLIQVSLLASMVANAAFVVYDAGWFRHTVKLGLCGIAFAATYTLLNVFPFAFDNAGVDAMVRILLGIGLIGIAIGAVVELFQLLFGWIRG